MQDITAKRFLRELLRKPASEKIVYIVSGAPGSGKTTYPDVAKDVYRRHENCRCTVEYDPGGAKRSQDL